MLLDELLGPGFAIVRWADAPEIEWPQGLPVRVVRVLRHEDDFLPGGPAQVRDVTGVIGRVLGQAGARAVVIRPDRHVLAYLPLRGEGQAQALCGGARGTVALPVRGRS